MIYVDDLAPCIRNKNWKYDKSCHLYTIPGNVCKLVEFAEKIGLKPEWLQMGSTMPHFDLTPGKRALAVKFGAKETTSTIVVAIMKEWRAEKAKFKQGNK